jgi:hypothetical protein
MGKYLQVLTVYCPLLFLMVGMLEAQRKTELIVGAMAMEVDAGTDRKPSTVTSDEAAGQLSRLLRDTTTRVIRQSQLRVSDGMTSMLKFGNQEPFVDPVCASPLTKHLGTGASMEITPHVHGSQEFTLHVVVSQDVKPGCLAEPVMGSGRNEFDVRLRGGEVAILGGLNALSSGDASSQLVIALIPTPVYLPDVVR